MDNLRLRNLTTGRLHTTMQHIYEDIELLTGSSGIMTHQIPNALRAMEPWMREKITDARFWDDKYDQSHAGETDVQPMSEAEQAEMLRRYEAMPHPFAKHMRGQS